MQQKHESQGSPHVAAEQADGHRGPSPRAMEALTVTSFDRSLQIELNFSQSTPTKSTCITGSH